MSVSADVSQTELQKYADRYWHCVAAELEAGLIDENGDRVTEGAREAGIEAYRDWRRRHPDYIVPKMSTR